MGGGNPVTLLVYATELRRDKARGSTTKRKIGIFRGVEHNYRLSKKQLPILYSKLLYKKNHYFIDIQHLLSIIKRALYAPQEALLPPNNTKKLFAVLIKMSITDI